MKGFGCVLSAAVGVALLLAVSVAGIATWAWVARGSWERAALPEQLAIERTIARQSVGLVEVCEFAVLALTETQSKRIGNDGIAVLDRMRVGRAGIELSNWAETPFRTAPRTGEPSFEAPTNQGGEVINALSAWSCVPAAREFDDLQLALDSMGSYYATFNHGDGLIAVIPEQERAVYLYFD